MISLMNSLGRIAAAIVCGVFWTVAGCAEPADPKDVTPPSLPAREKPAAEDTVDFEKAEPGKIPAGFTAALSGSGASGSWVVEEDASAPSGAKVLAQTSTDDTNKRYPVCVYDDLVAKDVAATVRFKPVSGKVDQAAGIVWRYRDKDNYYIVRANALENNVVLYKTEKGVRSDLKLKGKTDGYGIKADVPQGQWSTLAVVAKGDSFIVSLNDKPLFEVVDDTFAEAGKVGLWTKADSVTHFDDLWIESFDASEGGGESTEARDE